MVPPNPAQIRRSTLTTLARPKGSSPLRAEDGIRTRDPHLGKVMDLVFEVLANPRACRSVVPMQSWRHTYEPIGDCVAQVPNLEVLQAKFVSG
jgi:hypothetical protein